MFSSVWLSVCSTDIIIVECLFNCQVNIIEDLGVRYQNSNIYLIMGSKNEPLTPSPGIKRRKKVWNKRNEDA